MRRDLLAYLSQLFGDFRHWAFDVRPIEADTGGAILEAKSAVQGREINGQAVDDARPLPRLHPLPWLPRTLAVEMGMPSLHFGEKCFRDIVKIERPTFLGDDGVEQDLKQQVAQLFA